MALLRLAQWLTPGAPIGGFAYSQGLETAIASGVVADAAGLSAWLHDVLARGGIRNDAALLAAALRPGAAVPHLADLARALAPGAERAREAEEQGAAFRRLVAATSPGAAPPEGVPLPVAVGAAAASLDLPAATVIAFYLQSWAAAQVSAGQRLIPLGQGAAQAVLAGLAPAIATAAEAVSAGELEDLGSASIGADLAAMTHETQHVRLYRS